ncbi:MAG: hypothetical protein ACHQ4H_13830, partial [Ktedonobacterales bacterium]
QHRPITHGSVRVTATSHAYSALLRASTLAVIGVRRIHRGASTAAHPPRRIHRGDQGPATVIALGRASHHCERTVRWDAHHWDRTL